MPKENEILRSLAEIEPDIAKSTYWLPLILDLDQSTLKSKIPRKRIPQVTKGAAKAINENKHQEAVNQITLGLYLYPNRMADEIRRSGLFRSSKYKFHSNCLRRVLVDVLYEKTSLNLPQEFVNYGRSILNLTEVSKHIYKLNTSISSFIAKRQRVFLKTIVAVIEVIFMTEHSANTSLSTNQWEYYTKEDLADAASYLIFRFDDQIGIQDHHFNFIDEDALTRGYYHSIIVKSCKIRKFLEAEILIDAFQYQCKRQKHSYRIYAPNPQTEKSIRLGFIQREQYQAQMGMEFVRAISEGETSIIQQADLFYDRFHGDIVKFLTSPIQRYVYGLPNVPEFAEFISQDGLYLEEKYLLSEIRESESSTWEQLSHFKISDSLSVFDLTKVIRLFRFIGHLARRHLVPLLEDETHLVYRSLIPVYDEHKLNAILGWCLPPEKIRKFVDLMTWESGMSGLFDLQIKPIIRGGRQFLLPLNLLGTSNWYRNLPDKKKNRVLRTIEEDAVSQSLAEVIGRVCNYSRNNFQTKFDGEDVEIDVVARFGDILFIFECKHPFFPCSVHELRTSYDHIKKGSDTLTRIINYLIDRNFEKELYRRLGWDLEPAKEIVTCIVSCNGMFPGLSIDGHPIRRWAELRNMIESGVVQSFSINIKTDSNGFRIDEDEYLERNLWEGPKLTPEFLRRYISEDLLHGPIFRAMLEVERSYRIGNVNLRFSTFGLNPSVMQEELEKFSFTANHDTKTVQ